MDFFSMKREKERAKTAPLADRLRPRRVEEVVGQSHLLGEGKPLRRLIAADRIPSMILFGPPGTGKTTIASVIAQTTSRRFEKISAVTGGVKEVREVIAHAKDALAFDGQRTILFIDEIHRFNKAQQDALLPHVENGTLTLIGATTENPFFEVNKALLSRCQVMELKRLERDDLAILVERALREMEKTQSVRLLPESLEALFSASGGDGRILINTLEIAALSTPPDAKGEIVLDFNAIQNSVQKKIVRYDKGEEEHYNTISAFIKSVRGSDPDAAVYYLARMLEGGEDPLFIARRLVILASEDIGNAQPMGLVLANACYQACMQIGLPEARIILSQATTFLASSPKSNASYMAVERAQEFVRTHPLPDIPDHLKDTHYAGAKQLGRGEGYLYPHDFPGGYVLQNYLPDGIIKEVFYAPKEIGEERILRDYLRAIGGMHADK
uniref:replication-associated recombination protein A n=1 Tax=Ndongobacter massiliensis TaxID=1871025 RepID=UPI0009303B23|nr:replication-associated recombination protein A [Ndongobacter massiliensis]